MADDPNQGADVVDDGTDGDEKLADGRSKSEERIPYSRFEEERNRVKKAEQELQDLRSKLEEFEHRDMSEADRAKRRAEQAETLLEQMQNRVTTLEKGAWVRSAAAEMNFHDPEDAFSLLQSQLAGFEDPREAKRAVQQIAKSKKHLIREEKVDERPSLSRVFTGANANQQNGNGNGQQQRVTPQQAAAERELQFASELRDHLAQFRSGWTQPGGIF